MQTKSYNFLLPSLDREGEPDGKDPSVCGILTVDGALIVVSLFDGEWVANISISVTQVRRTSVVVTTNEVDGPVEVRSFELQRDVSLKVSQIVDDWDLHEPHRKEVIRQIERTWPAFTGFDAGDGE